jgi:hypothetical protein
MGALLLFLMLQVAPAPALSDVEALRWENYRLKSQLVQAIAQADACRVELAPLRTRINTEALRADLEGLTRDLERAHPGYTFNGQTGALEATPATGVAKP